MIDPSVADLAKQVTDLKSGAADLTTAANIVWTLLTGFLVMFMQAGFALVEAGLSRKKNAAHVMAMNFLVYSIGVLGFWVMGFAIQMGGVGALATFGNDATLSHPTARGTTAFLAKSLGCFSGIRRSASRSASVCSSTSFTSAA